MSRGAEDLVGALTGDQEIDEDRRQDEQERNRDFAGLAVRVPFTPGTSTRRCSERGARQRQEGQRDRGDRIRNRRIS